MGSTILKDVLSTTDVRNFVCAVDVNYGNDDFKNIIFDPANDNSFLLITKSIGSKIMITDVKVVNDDLVNPMIFGVDSNAEHTIPE